ncbi:ABC transporter ATP-binding protein [Protofrankia sp. BMG5.30]|nr:ATP-binding cassette domain-containing protein [Protofrankia sp. BMG5.30]ONH37209.1 ABC transporter ATP-binding protein [Protofrankia sp. BMG5.30]
MSIDHSVSPTASTPAPDDSPALDVRGLTYRFGEKTAVDSLDLTLAPGEIVGLLGPNGAGKTTAIRVIVTLLRPAAGSVLVFGVDAARQPIRTRRLIGYVPQMLSADSGLTGRENVALFAGLFDVPRRQRRARVDQALAAMGLTDVADRLARTYSGGMVRRLELAQALVNAPRLLILDEPTVGLDPIARDSVWEHVLRLREEHGMAVLLTTHYMEEADVLCDRVALMHAGRVQVIGVPGELKAALGARASLEDVFRHHTGDALAGNGNEAGDFRGVQHTRRAARRVG